MGRSLYLINPAADFPTYYGAESYEGRGYKPAAFLADLVVPTLAAMIPEDFHVELCDEHLEPVDFELDVDYVGITGKVSQWGRTKAIAAEFRRRGKTVIIGGPNASLQPDLVRPHADVFVRDEIEEIGPELWSDLREGRPKQEYIGTRPDLALSPVPRWDLYAKYNERVLTATLQTARGCPFECEFCDVIQYVGRKQRHKPIDNIVAELDMLYAQGYRSVLLADDNTTANKKWVKEMLAVVGDWNARTQQGRVALSTQLSIDAAMDDELLSLAASAGMAHVFIGIETPNEESLVSASKNQNLRKFLRNDHDENPTLIDQVNRFYAHGIGVTMGMICGFDHDGHDIFERQFEFAMQSAAPICTLSALAAPAATPLHARLEKDGRLVEGTETPGVAWHTNMLPRLMSRQELEAGIRWLANKLYHPDHFGDRILDYIARLDFSGLPDRRQPRGTAMRSVDKDTLGLISEIPRLDAASDRLWKRVMQKLPGNPGATTPIMEALVRYQQIRFMYEQGNFWDGLVTDDTPHAALAQAQAVATG
jgi:hypothetical protein